MPSGKEILGDLLEGKRTLMLIHLLHAVGDRERAELLAFLRRERADWTIDEAQHIKARMEHFGSFALAEGYVQLYRSSRPTTRSPTPSGRRPTPPPGDCCGG